MTEEQRVEKQQLCDKFIDKIDSLFEEFKNTTGIEFHIIDDFQFKQLQEIKIFKKRNPNNRFYYSPRIITAKGTQVETHQYIY